MGTKNRDLYIDRSGVRRVWRYQREVFRIRKSRYQREVIRIRKSTDRQHNDQIQKDKRTNNDLQNIQITYKDRVTRTPLWTGGELRCSERASSFCLTSDTRCVSLVTNPVETHEWGKGREKPPTCRKSLIQF